MNKRKLLRKAHRYIGLIISLQLLAWTIGGIWFAYNDINEIHGDHLKTESQKVDVEIPLISTQLAIDKLPNFSILKSLKLIQIIDSPVYQMTYLTVDKTRTIQLVNAITGNLMDEIDQQSAIEIAKSHSQFSANVSNVLRLTATNNHHEYRNKPLPAWAITFDYPSSPTFYIASQLGELTSVRHTSWRIFDFFWMLHTMDYATRDNFGNGLLRIFSVMALLTSLSGIVLFIVSRRKSR